MPPSPPATWDAFLDAHVFVINLERKPERYKNAVARISTAGFTNVNRFNAVDGRKDDMVAVWERHGAPRFDPSDAKFNDAVNHSHHQGIALSHLCVLREIIDAAIPWSVVFEDDVVFHKDWAVLAPLYFTIMPRDYDMCYIGHHCGCGIDGHVVQLPVYCTHAYGITLAGAQYLYNKILSEPAGVRTIDCMIWDYMCKAILGNDADAFLPWYAWNGESFPDETAKKNKEHAHKDMGLVFQEYDGDKYEDKI